MFTGDAGKEGLSKAIKYAHDNNIKLNDCSIIKMPHHGSRKNVNPAIMDAFVGSRALYYSCASDDLGHHPSQRLINLMNEKNSSNLVQVEVHCIMERMPQIEVGKLLLYLSPLIR